MLSDWYNLRVKYATQTIHKWAEMTCSFLQCMFSNTILFVQLDNVLTVCTTSKAVIFRLHSMELILHDFLNCCLQNNCYNSYSNASSVDLWNLWYHTQPQECTALPHALTMCIVL